MSKYPPIYFRYIHKIEILIYLWLPIFLFLISTQYIEFQENNENVLIGKRTCNVFNKSSLKKKHKYGSFSHTLTFSLPSSFHLSSLISSPRRYHPTLTLHVATTLITELEKLPRSAISLPSLHHLHSDHHFTHLRCTTPSLFFIFRAPNTKVILINPYNSCM